MADSESELAEQYKGKLKAVSKAAVAMPERRLYTDLAVARQNLVGQSYGAQGVCGNIQ